MEEEQKEEEQKEEEQKENDKEVKDDWQTKYNILKTEHQELLDKLKKEENIKLKDDTFKKYGLREENTRLYHRLLENSNDVEKDVKELMKDYPSHFGDKDTNIKESLPNKDYNNKNKEEKINTNKFGMIG